MVRWQKKTSAKSHRRWIGRRLNGLITITMKPIRGCWQCGFVLFSRPKFSTKNGRKNWRKRKNPICYFNEHFGSKSGTIVQYVTEEITKYGETPFRDKPLFLTFETTRRFENKVNEKRIWTETPIRTRVYISKQCLIKRGRMNVLFLLHSKKVVWCAVLHPIPPNNLWNQRNDSVHFHVRIKR